MEPAKFGISQITTKPWTFEQDLKMCTKLNLALELCEFKFTQPHLAEELKMVRASRVPITSVQLDIQSLFPDLAHPEPQDPKERLEKMKESLRQFSVVAPGCPFLTSTGALSTGNEAEVWDTCLKNYKELSKFAADHGVKIALEPLSPSLMNRSSILHQLPQAINMAIEVDEPNFGLCVDFYNVWQDPLVEEHIRSCEDLIFLVQLSDWKRPRSFQDRRVPGEGEIPLGCLLKAVQDTGYAGNYVLEIISDNVADSLTEKNIERVIAQSREGFLRAWEWSVFESS